MDTGVTYQYMRLPGSRYIRLIRLPLLDDYSTEPITCSLEVYELREGMVAYTSLSYSWAMQDGDASACREMFIDGQKLAITQNLYEGLLQIRVRKQPPLEVFARITKDYHFTTDEIHMHNAAIQQNTFSETSHSGQVHATSDFLLWVDAVCIDQECTSERNAQVAMMGEIYAHSSARIVWLGQDANDTTDDLAFLALAIFLEVIHHRGDRHDDDTMDERTGSRTGDETAATTTGTLGSLDLSLKGRPRLAARYLRHCSRLESLYSGNIPTADPDRHFQWATLIPFLLKLTTAVASLVGRRYFSRRWIFQEIHQCYKVPVHLHWGSFDLERTLFVRNTEAWQGAAVELTLILCGVRRDVVIGDEIVNHASIMGMDAQAKQLEAEVWHAHWLIIWGAQEILNSRWNVDDDLGQLIYWLVVHHQLNCADPRDRLYAFVGMLQNPGCFRPDYTLSVAEVCSEFAITLIREGWLHSVLFLAADQYRETERRAQISTPGTSRNSMASWVPDIELRLSFAGAGNSHTRTGELCRISESRKALEVAAATVTIAALRNRRLDLDVRSDVQGSDVICHPDASWNFMFDPAEPKHYEGNRYYLILRPIDQDYVSFRIIGCVDQGAWPPGGVYMDFCGPDPQYRKIWIY